MQSEIIPKQSVASKAVQTHTSKDKICINALGLAHHGYHLETDNAK